MFVLSFNECSFFLYSDLVHIKLYRFYMVVTHLVVLKELSFDSMFLLLECGISCGNFFAETIPALKVAYYLNIIIKNKKSLLQHRKCVTLHTQLYIYIITKYLSITRKVTCICVIIYYVMMV